MRGLPSCGKSYTAKRLAGTEGIVLETDEYFYRHVGDDPERFDYHKQLMPAARDWNFQRFVAAVDDGASPIVVDRGNGLSTETQRYARYAVQHEYLVELREPESESWQEIRSLLRAKEANKQLLSRWAQALSERSQSVHRVPPSVIQRRIAKWNPDLTVQDILDYRPAS